MILCEKGKDQSYETDIEELLAGDLVRVAGRANVWKRVGLRVLVFERVGISCKGSINLIKPWYLEVYLIKYVCFAGSLSQLLVGCFKIKVKYG